MSNGQAAENDPDAAISRHPVFSGFEQTDILSFGGLLEQLKTDESAEVLMTFIPPFPIYPPETSWMREPRTNIPGLIINKLPDSGKIAFMPADLDRQFARYNLPDHGNLIANLIRWASGDNIPLRVECAGLLDCNMYTKGNNLILHIVNLTSAGTWRQPVDEYIPVGPVRIRVRLPESVKGMTLRLLVSGQTIPYASNKGWAEFTLDSVTDHEVIVI
jgi:hypothetical protein